MMEISLIQDLIAELDLVLPWLLPALETLDQTVPPPVRLLVCVPLLVWLSVLRRLNAQAAAGVEHGLVQPLSNGMALLL